MARHSRSSPGTMPLPRIEPGLYRLLRFQKAAGRVNYETGNQIFSKRSRFLTIRERLRFLPPRAIFLFTQVPQYQAIVSLGDRVGFCLMQALPAERV